jgi:hypothetical protein
MEMHTDEPWIADSQELCQVCEHPLCNGECESQAPSQLILGGILGIAILGIALLVRAIA